MGLILCDNHIAVHPYYVEDLGVHLYSIEELCYVIYEYPLTVLEDFVGEPLFEFLKTELDLGLLSLKLEKMKLEKVDDQESLFLILEDSDYYSTLECSRYRLKIAALKKLHAAEYLKKKADKLFSLGRYGRAIYLYTKILKLPMDHIVNDIFKAYIYNNLGSSYANLFQLDKAYKAYDKAYSILKNKEILKYIYFISLIEPVIELKDHYQSMIRDEIKIEWGEEYQAILNDIGTCKRITDINDIFSTDSVKKIKQASDIIGAWKSEYRRMV